MNDCVLSDVRPPIPAAVLLNSRPSWSKFQGEAYMHKKTDSEIEQWVLRELGSEQKLGAREICVQSHDGVVTLNGSAPTYSEISAAERAVDRVAGIAGVVNDIQIKPALPEISKALAVRTLSDPFRPGALVSPRLFIYPVGGTAVRRT